jgi:hypothetical protein
MFDSDDLDADDLMGQVVFTPADVLKGEEGSTAGEMWWPIEEARGGVDPSTIDTWDDAKNNNELIEALRKRGLKTEYEGPKEAERQELIRRLREFGLGEVRLNAVFLLEVNP